MIYVPAIWRKVQRSDRFSSILGAEERSPLGPGVIQSHIPIPGSSDQYGLWTTVRGKHHLVVPHRYSQVQLVRTYLNRERTKNSCRTERVGGLTFLAVKRGVAVLFPSHSFRGFSLPPVATWRDTEGLAAMQLARGPTLTSH